MMTLEPKRHIYYEAFYYGNKLYHSLIKPNQVRAYGIDFWDNPFDLQIGFTIDF